MWFAATHIKQVFVLRSLCASPLHVSMSSADLFCRITQPLLNKLLSISFKLESNYTIPPCILQTFSTFLKHLFYLNNITAFVFVNTNVGFVLENIFEASNVFGVLRLLNVLRIMQRVVSLRNFVFYIDKYLNLAVK